TDAGKTRAALKRLPKCGELRGCADGIGFHAAVAQITNIPAEIQPTGFVFREIAKADALHESGDKEALCLFRVRHKPRNCSRRAWGFPNCRCASCFSEPCPKTV